MRHLFPPFSKTLRRGVGALQFLSKKPILDQICADIVAGLVPSNVQADQGPVWVYMGVHKPFGAEWMRRGLKIAVQTEQFYDESGHPLWASRNRRFCKAVLSALKRCDVLLDLSASNERFYQEYAPDLANKIIYGPHIFPTVPPEFCPASDPRLIFFGALNARRKAALDGYAERACGLDGQYFNEDLLTALRPYAGVLNLHFDAGTYTEAPRLLSAMRAGKVMVSEPLASGLVAGQHYFELGAEFDETQARETFEACATYLCETYEFQTFLDGVLRVNAAL